MKRYIVITVVTTDENGAPTKLVTLDLPDAVSRAKYYGLLNFLSDHDIIRGAALELPREGKGTWITFRLGDRHVVGLFDKNKPEFWGQGLFLGQLHVARILPPTEVTKMIAEGSYPL